MGPQSPIHAEQQDESHTRKRCFVPSLGNGYNVTPRFQGVGMG